MASQPRNPPTLEARIQALAQELQDLIFEFTIVVDTDEIITVTRDYKPPIGLQINKKLRRELAQSYYSSNVFQFLQYASKDWSSKDWLPEQDPEHLVLFKEIRMEAYDAARATILELYPQFYNDAGMLRSGLQHLMDRGLEHMEMQGLTIKPGVIKHDWRFKKSDGTEEVKWLDKDELEQLQL